MVLAFKQRQKALADTWKNRKQVEGSLLISFVCPLLSSAAPGRPKHSDILQDRARVHNFNLKKQTFLVRAQDLKSNHERDDSRKVYRGRPLTQAVIVSGTGGRTAAAGGGGGLKAKIADGTETAELGRQHI